MKQAEYEAEMNRLFQAQRDAQSAYEDKVHHLKDEIAQRKSQVLLLQQQIIELDRERSRIGSLHMMEDREHKRRRHEFYLAHHLTVEDAPVRHG